MKTPTVKILSLVAALAAAGLTGCATNQPQVPVKYLTVLKTKQVDPGTYARIAHGRILRFDDVLDLTKKGIAGDKVVDYMKATRAPYVFTKSQVNQLRAAGADKALLDYLNNPPTQPVIPSNVQPTPAWMNSPYFGDPYYMGPAPFMFSYPASWTSMVDTGNATLPQYGQ